MSFFQCFVKVDKTVAFHTTDLAATVKDLKMFAFDRFGIDVNEQLCKYIGRTLKDDDVLKDKIMQDGTVYIYFNLHTTYLSTY